MKCKTVTRIKFTSVTLSEENMAHMVPCHSIPFTCKGPNGQSIEKTVEEVPGGGTVSGSDNVCPFLG